MTIQTRFGTFRGLVRLMLSYAQIGAGRSGQLRPNPSDSGQPVTRLVFVCHGNICRSAFADVVSRDLGMRTASFGLSTSDGDPAHGPAVESAKRLGYDLSQHRTTRMEDFVPEPGDLLLAMEVRQMHRLAAEPRLKDVPRALLGLWGRPPLGHLHDPFSLHPGYMDVCLKRIDGAVKRLARAFPRAKLS